MLQAKRLILDTKETDTKGRKKQKKTKGRGDGKKEAPMKDVEVEKPKEGRNEDVVCGSVRTRCYGSSALGALLHVWPSGVLSLSLFISLH